MYSLRSMRTERRGKRKPQKRKAESEKDKRQADDVDVTFSLSSPSFSLMVPYFLSNCCLWGRTADRGGGEAAVRVAPHQLSGSHFHEGIQRVFIPGAEHNVHHGGLELNVENVLKGSGTSAAERLYVRHRHQHHLFMFIGRSQVLKVIRLPFGDRGRFV